MDNSSQKSAVTAQSVMEKIKSLSAKASKNVTNAAESVTGNTAAPANLTESPQSSSFGKTMRFILVFVLAGFLLLALLNALQLLPASLGELLNPYSMLGSQNKETKKEDKKMVKKQDKLVTEIDQPNKTDKSYDIPEVRKIAERRVFSPPTRLPQPGNPLPKPDISGTRTQAVRAKKSGYCYVGEDRGFRSCVHVSSGDKCMSGDIFPTQAVCINPNLRA